MNRDLRPLFFPRSVTLVGASSRPTSLPGAVLRNLQRGGYAGALSVVHPKQTEVLGVPAFPTPEAIPDAPELAVVGVAPDVAEATIHSLLARGTKAFVLLTAGFGELGPKGRAREEALARACRERGAVLMGSNCMGVHAVTAHARLDASFVRALPRPGRVALLAQSGSIGEWFFLRMVERDVGAALFASLGNMADLDVPDLLEGVARYFPDVGQVLLYLETMPEAGRFRAALAALPPACRVIALRGGTTAAGGRAVAGHTGALAAEPRLAAALLAGTGVQEVSSLTEAMDLMEAVDRLPPPRGSRVAVITNAGGPAVLAADELGRRGVTLPPLSAPTREALARGLVPAAVTTNPVDCIASAGPEEFAHALETIARSGEVDAMLPVFMQPIVTSAEDVARALVLAASSQETPSLLCWMPGPEAQATHAVLRDAGLAVIAEPTRAAAALAGWALAPVRDGAPWMDAAPGRRWPSPAPRLGDSSWGDPTVLETFLESEHVRCPPLRRVRTRSDAERAALELGLPLALKIERADAPHKGRVGLLALARDRDALTLGLQQLAGRAVPGDRWLVQKLVTGKLEIYAGFLRHPALGSFVGLGRGGGRIEALEPPSWLSLPASRAQVEAFARGASFTQEIGGDGSPGFEAVRGLISGMLALAHAAPEVAMAEVNPAVWDAESGTLWLVDARWEVATGPRL